MIVDLAGKKALIGGSSRGIGKAVAHQLAVSGASVTLMARSTSQLKTIVEHLPKSNNQKHDYLTVDFNDYNTYNQKISSYFEKNRVDILINNTQGPEPGSTLDKSVEDYQVAFDCLFKSVVRTTELALCHMQKQQWGRIINVSSISVREPLNYLALSNTIRAAVTTWAKGLSLEVAQNGITVNNILTGYFDTERIAQLNSQKALKMGVSEDEVRTAMEQQVPCKRIGKPEEYGYLAAFLASNLAAYINGCNIPIDGGLLRSM